MLSMRTAHFPLLPLFLAEPPVFQAMNMTMGKDGQTMGGVSFFNNIICHFFAN